MGNLLESASAWLGGVQKACLSSPVTYRRGGAGGVSCPWNVTIGHTTEEVQDTDGISVRVFVRDFIGDPSELVLTGNPSPIRPVSGDQIVEADGTVNEVMAIPGQGEWRWSDQFRQRVRVHTKQVNAA